MFACIHCEALGSASWYAAQNSTQQKPLTRSFFRRSKATTPLVLASRTANGAEPVDYIILHMEYV
eukprot:6182045-Pleurochrysis_carterae.AAC.1